MFSFSLESFAKRIDAKYNLPRPAHEQHLSSYRAFLRVIQDGGEGFVLIVCATLAVLCLLYAAQVLELTLYSTTGVGVVALATCAMLVAGKDCIALALPYQRIFQRETYGSNRWADVTTLKNLKLLTPRSKDPLPEAIPIATFGRKHLLTMLIHFLAEHFVFFGPPGSGKSASFFINISRAFSHVGGLLALDVKGEIYKHSAFYYENVYRFDLKTPACSDWFEILAPCRGNGKRAGQVASYMIGYDPNIQQGGENPFFKQAATLMLKCLILHLTAILKHPTPADIFEFIAAHPTEGKTNYLALAMSASPDPDVPGEWGAAFAQSDPRTLANVSITMLAALGPFRDPNVREALRRPTASEFERGRRMIDFTALRQKGTAIFVVVPEGEASRLESVVATLFAIATDSLRETGDDPESCYTLVMLDEAGNVPLRNLSEGVGVGRGRKIIYGLGYQNSSMPVKQYGRDTAFSILQSIGAKFFLSGVTAETAEYASRLIGKTTTMQRSSTDAVGNALDNEKLSEVGRDLMDTSEVRQMLRYTQGVAVINGAPPIRFGFPPDAKQTDTRICEPAVFSDTAEENSLPAVYTRPPAPPEPEPIDEQLALAIGAQAVVVNPATAPENSAIIAAPAVVEASPHASSAEHVTEGEHPFAGGFGHDEFQATLKRVQGGEVPDDGDYVPGDLTELGDDPIDESEETPVIES